MEIYDRFKARIKEREVKKHVQDNKLAYSCAATAVVVTGLTWAIMRGRASGGGNATLVAHPDGNATLVAHRLSFFSCNNSIGATTVNNYSGNRGHPGFCTYCIDCDDSWSSQLGAAVAHTTSPTKMHSHLTGETPTIGGHHLRRINLAKEA